MQFPTSNATWTDLTLVYADTSNDPDIIPIPGAPVLYAALGTTPGVADVLVPSGYTGGPLPVLNETSTTPSSGASRWIWRTGTP